MNRLLRHTLSPSSRRPLPQWAAPRWIVLLCIASTLGFCAPLTAQPDTRQMSLFVNNCLQCHTRPETGAPVIGAAEDWKTIASQGEEAILVNVVQGIKGMPPLGYCSACSEEDLRVMLRFIVGLPDKSGDQ